MDNSRPHPSPAWPILAALLFVGCRAASGAGGASSGTNGPITVEWIYSAEGRSIDDVPAHAWRADGRALLWDPASDEPTFELLAAQDGTRNTFVDREGALASLDGLIGSDQAGTDGGGAAEAAWGWPDDLDRAGDQGLYEIDGDLFVLDLPSSTFRRLTETEATETSASFSPDGSKVAFVRENDLFLVDLAGGDEQQLTLDGTDTTLNGTLSWVYWEELFGRRDIGYWWSDDSDSIAYLQSDESQVGTVQFTRFEQPYPEVITQRYPKAGSTNPTVRVGVVNVGGADQGNAPGPRTTWIDLPGEHEYVARVKWLPGSERLSVQTLTRDQRRLDLLLADPATGDCTSLLSETDEAWVNIHDDLYFLQDGTHFLWASERSGFSHLYLYTLDGDLVRQVTRGEWAIASSGGGVFWLRQAVCAIDEAAGWIYYTGLEDSSIERHLYRIRFDGGRRERLTDAAGTHAVSFSPDASHFLDTASTIGSLPTLSLVHADGTAPIGLQQPSDRLTQLDVQTPEFVQVTARDGQALPGWILKPRDFDPQRRYPLILYVYGGPSAPTVANAWDDDLLFDQALLDAGYLVARCDNRSSTAISKRLESTTHLRSIGDVERDDYVDAARWFKGLPYVDADRVGIWGWSGGGSMTLLMLTRSEEFAAGIAVAPVTDWSYYDTKWAEFMMKRPEDNPEGYEYTSLVKRAANLHGRLLLVHGTYDDNVHPQNAWSFIDELVTAGIPFDMMMYPMRKHGISDGAARIHLFNKMLEFWKAYL